MHQTSLGPKRCAKCFPDGGPNPHTNQLLEVGSHYPRSRDEEAGSQGPSIEPSQ